MESGVERTLRNLAVLGAISHNDKLMTNEDYFEIYNPTSLRGLVRMWYGERRTQNIARIRQTLRSAQDYLLSSEEDAKRQSDMAAQSVRFQTICLHHRRMSTALRKSLDGLENLCVTYQLDATSSSEIRLLIDEATDYLSVMEPRALLLNERHLPLPPVPPASPVGE